MKRLLLMSMTLPALTQAEWTFGPAEEAAAGRGVFHHLEASGRQALAVSAGSVAITWEDDRSGSPRCYLAIRAPGQTAFREQAFGKGECFAPGVTTMGNGRFGVIWEDEAGVSVAQAESGTMGPALLLAKAGGHGVLAWHPSLGLLAAWTAPEGRWRRLWLGHLNQDGQGLHLASKAPLEATPPKDDQMYPALAAGALGFTLAWEDRRLGHTVIFASSSSDGRAWSPPYRVSENPTGKAQGTDLGRGTGAMRPVLARLGSHASTIWLDKRDFLSGYDVYAALPGEQKNIKVQDAFGDAIAQWHPAAAGNSSGGLVVAWDDDRDGTQDIWLSWLTPQGAFAENIAPPPASGPGNQSDPVLALDDDGSLHLAWVERQPDGYSSIRYSLGHPIR